MVQFIGPIDWIIHEDILDVFQNNSLDKVEVLVDYFDLESDLNYKGESSFVKLKQQATASNWEIDLEIENCDMISPDQVM